MKRTAEWYLRAIGRLTNISRLDVSAPKTTDPRLCKIHIAITFASVASEEEARLIGSQIATDVLDRIAFEQNIWIGEPPAPDGHFVNVPSSGTEASSGRAFCHFSATGVGHALFEPDERSLARLNKTLNARRLKGQGERTKNVKIGNLDSKSEKQNS